MQPSLTTSLPMPLLHLKPQLSISQLLLLTSEPNTLTIPHYLYFLINLQSSNDPAFPITVM